MEGHSKERIIPIQIEGAEDNEPCNVSAVSGAGAGAGVGATTRRPRVANVNVPERIVICLDLCNDGCNTLCKMDDGTSYTRLNMLKRMVEMFVQWKLSLSPRSLLSVVALGERGPRWLGPFTGSARELLARVDSLGAEHVAPADYALSPLLDLLSRHVSVPAAEGAGLIAPPYVTRVILLYARRASVPRLPPAHGFLVQLRTHPYLYMDVLLLHDDECELHSCQQVYDALLQLDNGYSYVLESAGDAARGLEHAAKLLAHPLQRPLQKDGHYAL